MANGHTATQHGHAHHGHSHHGHSHHGHGHNGQGTLDQAFRWSVLLNAALVAIQLSVGWRSHSTALVADALHNLGDISGLLLSWAALWFSRLPASSRFPFGFGRVTVHAAILNCALVLVAIGVVLYEASSRLAEPPVLDAPPVMFAAALGIAVNFFSAVPFFRHQARDVGARAIVLHLLADAGISAGVLVSAILVYFTGENWIDPAVTLLVAAAVIRSVWHPLREAIAISLDAIPEELNAEAIRHELATAVAPAKITQLRLWARSTTQRAATVRIDALRGTEPNALLEQVKHILEHHHSVDEVVTEVRWSDPDAAQADNAHAHPPL